MFYPITIVQIVSISATNLNFQLLGAHLDSEGGPGHVNPQLTGTRTNESQHRQPHAEIVNISVEIPR